MQLFISDAHTRLKVAIGVVMLGASSHRCRDHFMRKVLAVASRGNTETVGAALRTVFAQRDADHKQSVANP